MLAVYLGMMDADFEVSEPSELVHHLRNLVDRYDRATRESPDELLGHYGRGPEGREITKRSYAE
jgi:hypothetical protein